MSLETAIETTLWSIEWGIAELVNHPEIQAKLRHELDTEPDVQKLPYLQAVVKETLRLRMAIPLLVPHMNLHDAKLNGFDIPAESKILVNAWWLANDPKKWKKPEELPRDYPCFAILGITIGRLVQNFEVLPPPGRKVDSLVCIS